MNSSLVQSPSSSRRRSSLNNMLQSPASSVVFPATPRSSRCSRSLMNRDSNRIRMVDSPISSIINPSPAAMRRDGRNSYSTSKIKPQTIPPHLRLQMPARAISTSDISKMEVEEETPSVASVAPKSFYGSSKSFYGSKKVDKPKEKEAADENDMNKSNNKFVDKKFLFKKSSSTSNLAKDVKGLSINSPKSTGGGPKKKVTPRRSIFGNKNFNRGVGHAIKKPKPPKKEKFKPKKEKIVITRPKSLNSTPTSGKKKIKVVPGMKAGMLSSNVGYVVKNGQYHFVKRRMSPRKNQAFEQSPHCTEVKISRSMAALVGSPSTYCGLGGIKRKAQLFSPQADFLTSNDPASSPGKLPSPVRFKKPSYDTETDSEEESEEEEENENYANVSGIVDSLQQEEENEEGNNQKNDSSHNDNYVEYVDQTDIISKMAFDAAAEIADLDQIPILEDEVMSPEIACTPTKKMRTDLTGSSRVTRSRSNTPMKQPSRTNTPVKQPSRTNTPVKQPSRANTPLKQPSRTNTPVKQPSRTNTPVKQPSRTNTPIKQPSRTNTPVKQASRTNTPVKTRESPRNVNSGKKLFPLFNKPKTSKAETENAKPTRSVRSNSSKTASKKDVDPKQMILDAGQKKIGLESCGTCTFVYDVDSAQDSKCHDSVHEKFVGAFKVPFAGWRTEKVVGEDLSIGLRILAVNGSEANRQHWRKVEEALDVVDKALGISTQGEIRQPQRSEAYLAVAEKKVVGFLLVEPIMSGDKVTRSFLTEKKVRVISEDLELSAARLKRFVGVSRIWVHPDFQRKGIASRLMNSMRLNYMKPMTVAKEDIALSHTTDMGAAFAEKYFGKPEYTVYRPDFKK